MDPDAVKAFEGATSGSNDVTANLAAIEQLATKARDLQTAIKTETVPQRLLWLHGFLLGLLQSVEDKLPEPYREQVARLRRHD
jgi:hypothetical protein